jgi:hypothetical protein
MQYASTEDKAPSGLAEEVFRTSCKDNHQHPEKRSCVQEDTELGHRQLQVKPRLFLRHGIWFCRLGNRMTTGETMREAYDLFLLCEFDGYPYG